MTSSKDSNILDHLADDVGYSFRTQSTKVGSVYTMSYNRAIVAIYDFDREQAGGLPKGGFLIAAKEKGDEGFILLRILKETRLPNAADNDRIRQQGVESTANKTPWAGALDTWIRDQVALHGIECRILGTFFEDSNNGEYKYAEDTDNYYSVPELMVWKPDATTLDRIVNYHHRDNDIPIKAPRRKVGSTRFAAAEKDTAIKADILLDPTDLLKRRTVYLGMSRSGKSNAMKTTAEGIYRLREDDPDNRIAQLIFDPNGEYAQDNPQDGPGLHRVHEILDLKRGGEVETYGLFSVPSDPKRWIMKINFFGDPLPMDWDTSIAETSLDQMLAGREIIRNIMEHETARYTTAFRDVDLSVPLVDAKKNMGLKVRYRRAVLVHQTALAAAGLKPPSWSPSIDGLFNKDIIDAMKTESNPNNDNAVTYNEAAVILNERLKNNNGIISWGELEKVFRALDLFIRDRKSSYQVFETKYIAGSRSGENWADPRLRNLLRIFESQNGPRRFLSAQDQHDPNSAKDFAEAVVEDLKKGKLVIIDQSTGDPEQNRRAAERIMWRVFNTQQDKFREAATKGGLNATEGHILVYVEEAHNLLPKANASDNLRTVWARSAKEGSKMNIGMVLATQAPSSIMPEILSETDNWIIAYLNSENERRVIAGYMDFGDFIEQIGQVSEPGFVRLRTLSRAYTIPVQFDSFRLKID